MRILLDEMLDRRLSRELPGHEVATVRGLGWGGARNGELLALADVQFDVLITADRHMRHQQDLSRLRRLTVVALLARNTRRQTLSELMPAVLRVLPALKPGVVTEI